MNAELLPVSVVIPTRHRAAPLRRTLESLAAQSVQPAELMPVLGTRSDDEAAHLLVIGTPIAGLASAVKWLVACEPGAASQRNQGVLSCTQPVVGFFG